MPAPQSDTYGRGRESRPSTAHRRLTSINDREGPMADDIVAVLNAFPGWVKETGLVILTATPDEVTCALEVGETHHQGYGIVHGGVHAGVIETLASIGAALVAMPRGQRVVGLENSTSFIRAVRSGRLHANACPVTRGRTSQVGA